MQPPYSKPFRWMMRIFFALWGTAGVAGAMALYADMDDVAIDLNGVAAVMAILCACMAASAIVGLMHLNKKESQWFSQEMDAELNRQSPAANIVIGLAALGIGAGITTYTHYQAMRQGGEYYLMYGLMIFGSLQALYGASQYGQQHRRRKEQETADRERETVDSRQ